jgi:hypothetical protein
MQILASMMNYNVVQNDSLLVVDKGIATRQDKFVTSASYLLYMPVGKRKSEQECWLGQ